MARYVKIKNGDDEYVWDQETDILYIGEFSGDFVIAKPNIHQLSKFCPYADDLGSVDEFPGKITTPEEQKAKKLGND